MLFGKDDVFTMCKKQTFTLKEKKVRQEGKKKGKIFSTGF